MPGLVPGIHVFRRYNKKDVDGRDKPGHDGGETSFSYKGRRQSSHSYLSAFSFSAAAGAK